MEQKIKQDINIGRNIRDLRRKKKMTQDILAAKMQLLGCNTTRSSLAKIEAGIQHISASELCAIKEVLNASYDEILKCFTENKE
ncbi:MAG: helix-turn-helix domain-containing protein [Oscillospiraceae bacterium]|nr:helix-turn-helix domain-containing protein [Oscillospiraceae bacterium]